MTLCPYQAALDSGAALALVEQYIKLTHEVSAPATEEAAEVNHSLYHGPVFKVVSKWQHDGEAPP